MNAAPSREAFTLSISSFGVAARRVRSMPHLLAGVAVVVALLLGALSLPVFGLPFKPPVARAASARSLWMLFAGGWVLRGP